MIKDFSAISLSKRIVWIIIAIGTGAILVPFATAWFGTFIPLVIIAIAVLGLIFAYNPYYVLLLWLWASTLGQQVSISLPGSLPALQLNRTFLLILILIVLVRGITGRRGFHKPELEDWIVLIFISWGLISILIWKPISLVGQLTALLTYIVLPMISYRIAIEMVDTEHKLKQFIVAATLLVLVLAVPAVIEEFTGVSIYGVASQSIAGIYRVQSFTISPWDLGTELVILCALATHAMMYTKSKLNNIIGWAAFGLGGVAVLFTFLRGTWLAYLLVVVIIFGITPKLRKWLVIAGFLCIPVFIQYGPKLLASEVWNQRVASLDNITSRSTILQFQIEQILRNPILGNGLQPSIQIYDVGSNFTGASILISQGISHNSFMSLLVDFGLVGILYILPILIILIKSLKTYQKLPSGLFLGKELMLALLCAALGFIIEGSTFETRLFPVLTSLFWFTLGLIRVVGHISNARN